MSYLQNSDMIPTLVCNKIVDHSDVVGASLVGAAPTISSFWLNTWLQWIGHRQLQDDTRNIQVLGFDVPYTRGFTSTGACLTIAIWRCRRPLNQWRRSFQMKAALPLANRPVIGSYCSRKTGPRTVRIIWLLFCTDNDHWDCPYS